MANRYYEIFDRVLAMRSRRTSDVKRYKRASLYYAGYDPRFHKYQIYNGQEYVYVEKKTLRMGKKVCEDWASLLWSEKLDLAVPNKENVVPYLVDIGFWSVGAKAVELAFGLGFSCVSVDIDFEADPETGEAIRETGKISLSYHDALHVYPLSWERGEMSEVAIISDDGNGRRMVAHLKGDDGKYIIAIVEETGRDGKRKFAEIETGSDEPLFAIFYPNVVDNQSLTFHGYASIIQNSIGTLQAIDNAFDGMDNEITLGRKRVFVSAETERITFKKDEKGNKVSEYRHTFDPNDALYYQLPATNGTANDKPLVYSPNDPLRIDQFAQDIKLNLQLLSQQVGLGNNYYTFEQGSVITATQVISQNSDTFRNLKKHEQVLERAIKRLYRGIVSAASLFTANSPFGDHEDVKVVFDDSVIEDKSAERERDLKDLAAGVISKSEFREKWMAEDEGEAKGKVDGMVGDEEVVSRFAALAPALSSSVLTSRMAAYLVFRGKEQLLKEAGYSSFEEYADEIDSGKASFTADDIFGMGSRADDGGEPKEGKRQEGTENRNEGKPADSEAEGGE